MKTVFENDNFVVEVHNLAPKPFWVVEKNVINPLHPVECFYDEERAILFAKGEL